MYPENETIGRKDAGREAKAVSGLDERVIGELARSAQRCPSTSPAPQLEDASSRRR